MAISTKCAACGRRYQAADHMAGRRVRCKNCGTTFQLPAEPTSDEPFDTPRFMDEDNETPGQGRQAPAIFDEPPVEEEAPEPEPEPVQLPPMRQRPTPELQPPFGDEPFDPNAEDVDSVFEGAFQDYAPSRGNTPFVFPGSRELDRWLPTVLVVGCVGWLAWLTLGPGELKEPGWVRAVRLLVLLMAYTGIVFPICLKGVRLAAKKLNYDLPSHAPIRAFATFLLPVTLGCAVWLSTASVPGFILGAVLGLVVALPAMWLLFRIRTDDAPTSLGYGAGAYGAGLAAAILILAMLNLITVGVVRKTKAAHTLAMSPFGPGFTWDGPTIVEKPAKKSPLAKTPARGVPVAPTTKAFSGAPVDGAPPVTQPSEAVAASQPAVAPPTVVEATPAPPTVTDPGPPVVVQPAHGPIVVSATPRVTATPEAFIHPLLPGRAVAVIKPSVRPNEDRVELVSTADWATQKDKTFARSPNRRDNYQLSFDGTLLARLTEFPALAAQVYSFATDELLTPSIKIDPAGPAPYLAGFIGPDQLLIFYPAGALSTVEVRDVKSARRLRNIEIPGLRAETGYFAVSRDGKQVAVIVRDDAGGNVLANGRLEVYNLSTQKMTRRIMIDELQWSPGVRPSGLAFTEEADKVAVLFEHQGQGLFLCWGASDDIPVHQHLYPGGLVPEGVNTGMFRGQSFVLLENGRSWLLYGASVFDTASGRELGRLGIKGVWSQKAMSPDKVLLEQEGTTPGTNVLLEVKLDVPRARRAVVAKP